MENNKNLNRTFSGNMEDRKKRKRINLNVFSENSLYKKNTNVKKTSSGDRYNKFGNTYNNSNRFTSKTTDNHTVTNRSKSTIPYQVKYSKDFVDMNQPMRLNKFLANSNICSRRQADEFIQTGVVNVNGKTVTELGIKVIPAIDKVYFHDQPVSIDKKIYILLNKPKNVITTSDDPKDRKTVLDLVKNACSERIYPVGRLDRNTTGVILITNDGDLASKLTHPRYERKKIYQVRLDKDFSEEDMYKMRQGLLLEDGEIKVDDIAYVKEDSRNKIGVEIHSGKNRIVRRMFEYLGYKVIDLDRVYFAGLTKKNLPRGKWRFLSEKEVSFLKMNPQR